MKLILFTSELIVAGEAAILKDALDAGLYRIHVKRNMLNQDTLRAFLDQFEEVELNRFVLHSGYELAAEYPVAGIHLPEKTRLEGKVFNVALRVISSSFHSVPDFEEGVKGFEYGFIGPVFNSISKPNYQGVDSLLSVSDEMKSVAVPIGGITPGNIQMLMDSGFTKSAVRGFVWEHNKPSEAVRQFVSMYRNHLV